MTYSPPITIENGIPVKTLDNWKIVQVSNGTVCAVSYDTNNNRQWVTTEIVSGSGDFVFTKSGTTYRLPKKDMHASLWMMGLQLKRPKEYANLKKAGVI